MTIANPSSLVVVNFAHPLTAEQVARVAVLAGQPVEGVIDAPAQIDPGGDFVAQAAALVGTAGLSPTEWQTRPLLVNPPGYAPLAAVVLAHLHGLMGHFPTVLRLRPVSGAVPPAFEVAELLPLQAIRDAARKLR